MLYLIEYADLREVVLKKIRENVDVIRGYGVERFGFSVR